MMQNFDLNESILVPYDKSYFEKARRWLQRESVSKWLDMGLGKQKLSDIELHVFLLNHNNKIFLYGPSEDNLVGLMCLNGFTHRMGLGEVWGIRGEAGGSRYLTISAFLRVIATGFFDCNLESISTWVAEPNFLSHKVHERCGFKPTGRLRQAYVLDGRRCDRILYDVTREEFSRAYPNVLSFRKMKSATQEGTEC
ncbi:GNAT family N-acetyltransferase [Pseudobacteriovorax antillogorgiicola]|uniref:Protein N-acetyltransferase, RimJ/RimL family n=1 Tax=Pseudobacteriovorax antillogorgiicola TaxID=1513793 RepID=A0A1Y6C529_9BACT|nr:GNAT family protein [Pseudobacteriovorax antillogorgiicola]TCS51200.1 RimJ/RimL family protein N-acetyltransferase [Pseudobacteriovorax antillogorgiicola]SMF37448.1 Protein N-acetyltransferase, RimJ/RimL family [Pseudobacteriovorax antillogorgiicola]